MKLVLWGHVRMSCAAQLKREVASCSWSRRHGNLRWGFEVM